MLNAPTKHYARDSTSSSLCVAGVDSGAVLSSTNFAADGGGGSQAATSLSDRMSPINESDSIADGDIPGQMTRVLGKSKCLCMLCSGLCYSFSSTSRFSVHLNSVLVLCFWSSFLTFISSVIDHNLHLWKIHVEVNNVASWWGNSSLNWSECISVVLMPYQIFGNLPTCSS